MALRAGLIGFGLAGRYFHAPLLVAAGIELKVVSTSRDREVLSIYPDAAVVANADDLIARKDIDLVVIASPNPSHVPHARAALLAGKHVAVDKPLSITSAEARALAELAQKQQRKLAVFQNRRWDSDFLTIRALLERGQLGDVVLYRARWDRYRPVVADRWRERPEPGSGILYDLGSHLIDQALCLFGRPHWIQADVFSQRAGAVVDDGFEILMGSDELRISLGVSSLAAAGDWRYCIHGTQASFFKRGLDPQEDQSRGSMKPDDPQFGIEPASLAGTLVDGASGASWSVPSRTGRWSTFYELLRQSIETNTPEPVTATEAGTTIEIIEAAHRSSREGRRIEL